MMPRGPEQMKRRTFFTLFAAPTLLAERAGLALPGPKNAGGMSVETALAKRRSIRNYTGEALTVADVGQLLWAAQGVTSADGKRTAPSAMHR